MKKIDLHQDLISKFEYKIEAFTSDQTIGLPSYQKSDIQIIWASIWPYTIHTDDKNKTMVEYSSKKIINLRQQLENLRKINDINIILDGDELEHTRYMDYKLNFVYHLKGADNLKTIEDFDKLKKAGFRSIQLVREFDNKFAHSHNSTTHQGLTDLGKEVVQFLEQNKMIIDTANMNYESMIETYKYTNRPIMNSHTNLYSLYKHSRNVTDEMLELISRSEGLIGLSLTSNYMSPKSQIATIDQYIEQIKYAKNHVGDDHVAFGSGHHSKYSKQLIQGQNTIAEINILEERIIQEFGYKFAEKFFRENAYRFLVHTI